jgi:hypothetical protein
MAFSKPLYCQFQIVLLPSIVSLLPVCNAGWLPRCGVVCVADLNLLLLLSLCLLILNQIC